MKTNGARKAAARGHRAPGREAVAAGDEPAWREHYRALVVFHRERGHCDVPSGARPHRALAAWLTTQREREAKGRLDPARKAALEELGVEFTRDEVPEGPDRPEGRDGRWDQRFAELAAFHARFGHTRVAKSFPDVPGLGHWRHHQRVLHRAGKLDPRRRKRLEALGFEWEEPACRTPDGVTLREWDSRREYRWEQMCRALAEYRERHGHCLVKRQESVPLAKWTTRQREHYRAGALSAVRVQKLEALGFSWNPERAQFAGAWEERYAQLVAFHRQHGHTRVSKAWKKNPGLGHWRHFQRILQREGKMDAGRRERLDALGFEWEEAHVNWQSRIPQWEQLWELRFRELRAFTKRFGHCLVVTGWRENPALAKWVQKQRGKYRTGLLRTDQIQRLEALDFAWEPDNACFDNRWEARFEELTAFHRRFGHTRVPAKWKENPPLAAWKFQQRKRHRAGQLSAERKARLDALGFEWME